MLFLKLLYNFHAHFHDSHKLLGVLMSECLECFLQHSGLSAVAVLC